MRDSFGRTIDYLRISITDRCPARCVYCMPKTGVHWIPHKEILSFEELLRITILMAEQGVTKIKVTGGEPLARRGSVPFICRLIKIANIKKVSLTTNAILLENHLAELLEAGLHAINISLDSLDQKRFERITNTHAFDSVMRSLDMLLEASIPLKINCVPVKGYNESDITALALLAKTNTIAVRFIELMPLGFACNLSGISNQKIMSMLEEQFGTLTLCKEKMGEGPAVYYQLPGFAGKIGFISPLTGMFCASCNRFRLTSTGLLKPCLGYETGFDIKTPLRQGMTDEKLKAFIQTALLKKPAAHNFAEHGHKQDMHTIGG